MVREFLQNLCKELEISPILTLNERGCYPLQIAIGLETMLRDLGPGLALTGKVAPLPLKGREDLFIFVMRANLLGQGAGGARLGIEDHDKTLTLSLGLPYEMNYRMFKETVEDFVNYLVYWREEISKFEKQQQTVL